MDFRLLLTVFATVFAAELGDKTQLATLLYASKSPNSELTVFFGSALALVLASAIGVFAGSLAAARIDTRLLARLAGVCFVVIGIWTFAKA